MKSLTYGLAAALLALTLPHPDALGDDRTAEDLFEARVRPLLASKCRECHSGDSPKGGLDVTSRAGLLAGGDSGEAVVPGKPDESFLLDAIAYEFEPRMPPKGKLPDAEIAAVRRWIEMGAPWPGSLAETPGRLAVAEEGPAGSGHWAFQPVKDVELPEVRDGSWPRTPIDQFILAKLESEDLAPSPEADRRTLIRRLRTDLTGLPPTPEEVEAFEADDSPDAYERLVDRLLSSPEYGEHWARQWLDIARYSDTKGYVYAREEFAWVHAWAYRDWVVRALNEDLPYDRFLLLQLAADQTADDPSDLAAMGFLTLGRRFLGVTHDILDDRIDVVTRGTLGLTVACARCHDHKYDPIPTADYYALYGVFRNCVERLVPATSEENRPSEASPFTIELRKRQSALDAKMTEARAAAADRVRERVTEYLLAQFELEKYPENSFSQILTEKDLIPDSVRRWRDTLARAGERGDPVFRAWHAFADLRAEEFESRATEVSHALGELSATEINPLVARAFVEQPRRPRDLAERYGALFGDVIEQWEQLSQESEALAEGLFDPDAEAIRQVLYGPDSPCEVPDEPMVHVEYFFPTATTAELWKLRGEVDRWLINSPESPPYALILEDRPETTEVRVFRRGNPANLGEVAPRQFLRVLSDPVEVPSQRGSGRLELARAIIDPSNPLTARVLVNRVWMHHFGAGLVRSPGDFGTRAEPPSHPELLDWLASRFVAEGWSLKRLHREIVLSATYRQSTSGPSGPSRLDRAKRLDPEDRWLWRMPARRLTIEELRDALLRVTGELSPLPGGKPVELFQRPYSTRRSLYGRIDRQDLPTVLRTFDFANPDLLIPQRSETTVPQQALFFLNHPFLLERARSLASHETVTAASSPEGKVRALYHRVYQREPTASQLAASLALVRSAEAEPVPERPRTADDWRYGVGRFDEESGQVVEFRPLPHFTGESWQGGPSWPDSTFGWARLTPDGGHPGNDRAHAVVRRWVAPHDATVRIRSRLIHEVEAGDGVRAVICGSRPGTIATAEVHNGSAELDAGPIEVRAGDAIDFVVDIGGGLNSDQFLWAPVVSEIGPESQASWDARADFVGNSPAKLDPWEQLAQVLLMANEFQFID